MKRRSVVGGKSEEPERKKPESSLQQPMNAG